jgi:hemerythrin superfamily protein
MNILDELRHDHQRLRAAMARLETRPANPGDLAQFSEDLLGHARAEDESLFRELEPALPPGHGPIAVMRAEHEEIESGLAHLARGEEAGGDADARLARLFALARDHFGKEEEILFEFAEQLISLARLEALGVVFRGSRAADAAEPTRGASPIAG